MKKLPQVIILVTSLGFGMSAQATFLTTYCGGTSQNSTSNSYLDCSIERSTDTYTLLGEAYSDAVNGTQGAYASAAGPLGTSTWDQIARSSVEYDVIFDGLPTESGSGNYILSGNIDGWFRGDFTNYSGPRGEVYGAYAINTISIIQDSGRRQQFQFGFYIIDGQIEFANYYGFYSNTLDMFYWDAVKANQVDQSFGSQVSGAGDIFVNGGFTAELYESELMESLSVASHLEVYAFDGANLVGMEVDFMNTVDLDLIVPAGVSATNANDGSAILLRQVPEPSVLALMGLGLIGMFGINRRRS